MEKKTEDERVSEAHEMAPAFEFAPDDILVAFLTTKGDQHGLGYTGIESSSILSQNYAQKRSALKTRAKGKGILGQVRDYGSGKDYGRIPR